MYYKLFETIEYDMGEMTFSSKKILSMCKAQNKSCAALKFLQEAKNGLIDFSVDSIKHVSDCIEEVTKKEYEKYVSWILKNPA